MKSTHPSAAREPRARGFERPGRRSYTGVILSRMGRKAGTRNIPRKTAVLPVWRNGSQSAGLIGRLKSVVHASVHAAGAGRVEKQREHRNEQPSVSRPFGPQVALSSAGASSAAPAAALAALGPGARGGT